ncbi:MAG: hypothetical protein NC390_07820 [Fusobacterium sp.]|nr:hypothetical protein [Fusobacterium sp.]
MEFLQKLQENKPLFFALVGGCVLVVLLAIIVPITVNAGGGNKKADVEVSSEPIKEDVDLLTTDNLGKALEIQALLAKQDIAASRAVDGTKSRIFLKKGDCTTGRKRCTTEQRDKAIIAIVESGLFDQNVGLEIFDKGDFTSTKEDKKIRLARAINGELSRLIRKINPIENASVFISIPEQSMFAANQKPVTATVQITMPIGEKLDQTKVKAISNLLLGSVSGLTNENIAITDTNGNVYHSLMGAQDEMLAKLEENDRYMQKKVAAQLDRLLNGKGNYVVTVSTHLVQSPIEKFSIIYDPTQKTAVTEQSFQEGLGDQTADTSKGINAVSVYLPNGLAQGDASSSQNRNYSRQATETQYGVTKTQVNEYIKPGVMEEISIAVTIEKSALPANTTIEELKDLIAKAASPKASSKNVSIAFSDSQDPYLASDRPVKLAEPDKTGNPWWLAVAISALAALFIIGHVSNKIKRAREEQQAEVESLRQLASQQEQQLQAINMRANQLTAQQSELAQGLMETQQRGAITQQDIPQAPSIDQLVEALTGISSDISDISDEDAADKIKSWIEKS